MKFWQKVRVASVHAWGQGVGSESVAAGTSQAPGVGLRAIRSSLKIRKSLPNILTNIPFQSICHSDQFILGLNIFD